MEKITSDDKELYRLGLMNSDERAIVACVLKVRNPRLAALLMFQYLTNNLKDECQGCSICCRKEGMIDLDPEDVKRIAAYLEMTVGQFLDQYVEKYFGDIVLKKQPCVFLKKGRCSIYPVRPNGCVLYPFIGKHQSSYLNGDTDSIGRGVPLGCPSAQRAYLIMATLERIFKNRSRLRS